MKITAETKAAFLEFCRERFNDEDCNGAFSLGCFSPLEETTEEGEPLWEFHASNYQPEESYDIFELFESVQPEFKIEIHGHDDFYIVQ